MDDNKEPKYGAMMANLAHFLDNKLEPSGFALIVFDGEDCSFVSNRPTSEAMHYMKGMAQSFDAKLMPEHTILTIPDHKAR